MTRDRRRATATGPLAVRGFVLLLVGQFTSSVGDLCYAVALPWMVLSGGGDPVLLGVVLAVYGVVRAVGIPVGGLLADRFSARSLMLVTDSVRAVLVTALGVAALHGLPPATFLLPTAALIGAGEGLFLPASFALLPSIMSDDDLQSANSISSVANQSGSVLGPVLGGALVATVGAGPALLVDAATFVVSAVSLYTVRPSSPATTEATDSTSAAPVTLREVLVHGRLLQVMLLVGVIGNLVYGGVSEVALPTLAHRGYGPGGYSALLVGLAAGMIVGALLASRFGRWTRPASLIAVLAAVMALSVAATPFLGGLVGAVAAVVVFAVANSWSGIMMTTMLQVWAPRQLLGRIMSVLMLALTGTFPVSVTVAGLGIGRFGVDAFFPVAGVAIAIGVSCALLTPAFRQYRAGNRFSLGRTAMSYDALAELRGAGHPVDMLSSAQQRVLAELTPDEVRVLNAVKVRIDAVSADLEVQGQELKLL